MTRGFALVTFAALVVLALHAAGERAWRDGFAAGFNAAPLRSRLEAAPA